MLGLKLNHVSKRGQWRHRTWSVFVQVSYETKWIMVYIPTISHLEWLANQWYNDFIFFKSPNSGTQLHNPLKPNSNQHIYPTTNRAKGSDDFYIFWIKSITLLAYYQQNIIILVFLNASEYWFSYWSKDATDHYSNYFRPNFQMFICIAGAVMVNATSITPNRDEVLDLRFLY